MIDLDAIPDAVIIARGRYATIRARHEDCKKELARMCGELSQIASKILRTMQPGEDEIPESVELLISAARQYLVDMENCVAEIESLARQRATLKKSAWGKGA